MKGMERNKNISMKHKKDNYWEWDYLVYTFYNILNLNHIYVWASKTNERKWLNKLPLSQGHFKTFYYEKI
jgi:hypothetical protein